MTARLPSRITQLFSFAILVLSLPLTMLGAPGNGGQHGGGGGHAGGGFSGGGHVGGAGGGHSGHASGSPVSSAPSHGSHGAPATSGSSGPHAGSINNATAVSGGHMESFVSSGAGTFSDPATQASLAHMAGHGWHFLPSSGVKPITPPVRSPIARPTALPTVAHGVDLRTHHHHPHGPFVFGVIPVWGFYGGAGFGGCFFNGFTTVCNPFYGGPWPCSWYGYGSCGAWGAGWGWGGYSGYGLTEDYGYDQMGSTPDSYSDTRGMEIVGGYYGDTAPADQTRENFSLTSPPDQSVANEQITLTQLVLKDGSAYAVRAYWVSGTELYYKPLYGGTNHVALDQLDLSATVEANSRTGVPFTLSTKPPQQ